MAVNSFGHESGVKLSGMRPRWFSLSIASRVCLLQLPNFDSSSDSIDLDSIPSAALSSIFPSSRPPDLMHNYVLHITLTYI